MIKKHYSYIGLIVVPSLLFGSAGLFSPIWWMENVAGIPAILVGYYAILFVFFLLSAHYRLVVCTLPLAFIWLFYLTPASYEREGSCVNTLSIVQYNLRYENPDLSSFIEYVRTQPIDLVVLQEVSPEHGEQFRVLDNVYPYQYGGQSKIGYPSGQMVLSKSLLYGMNVHNSAYGHKLIQGIWQPKFDTDIALYVGHPPSPRSESLWVARNSTIGALEALVSSSALNTTLVVGDFNLSSQSQRYKEMLVGYEQRPIGSWPTKFSGVVFPSRARIAIDHLWLKSEAKIKYVICSRRTLLEFEGSDHSPILTSIGTILGN